MSTGKNILVLSCFLASAFASAFAPAVAQGQPDAAAPAVDKKESEEHLSPAEHASKEQLIKELLVTARSQRNAEMGFNLVLDQMGRGLKESVLSRIAKDTKMTDEQKAEVTQKSLVYINSHIQRLKQVAAQKLDLPTLVCQIYVPLYDKHYTKEDIQAMLAYYKSPIGQKSLDLMPQIVAEATKNMNAVIIPKLQSVSAEMEAEDKAGKIGPPAQ
jgi:hypothetical protein